MAIVLFSWAVQAQDFNEELLQRCEFCAYEYPMEEQLPERNSCFRECVDRAQNEGIALYAEEEQAIEEGSLEEDPQFDLLD